VTAKCVHMFKSVRMTSLLKIGKNEILS